MKSKTEIYLLLMAIGFIVFGLAYLVLPYQMAPLSSYEFSNAAGATEMRAIYGGIQVGPGIFLWWCARDKARVEAGLLFLTLVFACLGSFRCIGLLVDQEMTPMQQFAAPFEISLAIISGILLRRWKSDLAQT